MGKFHKENNLGTQTECNEYMHIQIITKRRVKKNKRDGAEESKEKKNMSESGV